MQDEMKEFWYRYIVIVVALIWGVVFGYFIAIDSIDDDVSYLTNKTQDQFFSYQQLQVQLAKCEYERGITNEIVLNTFIVQNER